MRSSNVFLAISAALLASCPSLAADLLVPSQYPTIQSAVTAALNGDRVLVSPGIYPESINLQGKQIRLESSQGAPSTLLDRGPVGGGGTLVTTGAGTSFATVVKGFTLRAASTGIVVSQGASVRVESCVFQSISSCGIRLSGAEAQVLSCRFADNTITEGGLGGAAILADAGSSVVIDNSEFFNNRYLPNDFGQVRIGGAIRVDTSNLVVRNSIFTRNEIWGLAQRDDTTGTNTGGGAIGVSGGSVDLEGCRFELNSVYGRPFGSQCGNGWSTRGGALLVDQANVAVRSGCVFDSNLANTTATPCASAAFFGTGGAISLKDIPSAVTITGVTFRNGRVTGTSAGLSRGAEMRTFGPIALTVSQCRFERTISDQVDALNINGGSIFFSDNVFQRSFLAIQTFNTGGFIDRCQFRDVEAGCVSATSQITVRNSEVCNPPPQPYQGTVLDGGGNVTLPLCLAADCNGNGVEDAYDISAGFSFDCNANAVPDECEIASGAESDCNADEILDSCQLRVASLESPSLGPVNHPTILTHTFQNVAKSGSSVTVTFTAVADLDSPLEYLTPRLNSSTLSRLWETDGYNCPTESAASVTLTAAQFNEILGSGTSLQVAFTPSIAVSSAAPCGNSFVRVRVTYQPVSTVDCDGNGALDLCEILSGSGSDANNNDVLDVCEEGGCSADFNANGVVDGTDLAVVLAAWGPCAGASCAADINRDGSVNGLDLTALLAAWGPCGP
jgi:hypothetical protein